MATAQTTAPAANKQAVVKKAPLDLAKQRINSEAFMTQLKEVMPPGVITPERAARTLCLILTKKPELADPSVNQASLYNSMLDCYRMGVEPDGRQAHLILYGTEVKLMLDYKGMVDLVLRSEKIDFIDAFAVYENDAINVRLGCDPNIDHTPCMRGPRGAIIGAYAIAHIKGQKKAKFVYLPKEEIDKIRASSKAANSGPWVDWYDEMAKKSAIRRLAKTLPFSYEEVGQHIDRDTEREFSGDSDERFRTAKRAKVNVDSPLPQVTDQAPAAQAAIPATTATTEPKPSDPAESKTEKLQRIINEEQIDEAKFIAFVCPKFGVTGDITSIEELAGASPKKFEAIVSALPTYLAELKAA